jgi:arylsulfatase A-like enzyme
VFADLASAMDVLPTLLSASGAAIPVDRTLDGDNLLPWLAGQTPPLDRTFFYFRGRILEGVREGGWKYRFSRQTDSLEQIPEGTEPVPELYDLELDPSERYNVASEHPEIVARLQARVARLEEEFGWRPTIPDLGDSIEL